MSERYSRLFSLPTNLYTEGSPVLIAAGALLKDNHTNKVLAQLKFRNISDKEIKSVKLRINAYDTAGALLEGVESFSYLDFSAPAGEEFGQKTAIYLPDITTRAFSVDILSVAFSDNEIFAPQNISAAQAAPREILEGVQRVEAEKQAARAAMEAVRLEQEAVKDKQCRLTMLFGFVSLALVLLSIFLQTSTMPFEAAMRRSSVALILALLVPCLCMLAAFVGKKKPAVIKAALIACAALFAFQFAGIIIYHAGHLGRLPVALRRLTMKIDLFRYIHGHDFGIYFSNVTRMLGKLPLRVMIPQLKLLGRGFCCVLPNILCTGALLIHSKKIK